MLAETFLFLPVFATNEICTHGAGRPAERPQFPDRPRLRCLRAPRIRMSRILFKIGEVRKWSKIEGKYINWLIDSESFALTENDWSSVAGIAEPSSEIVSIVHWRLLRMCHLFQDLNMY